MAQADQSWLAAAHQGREQHGVRGLGEGAEFSDGKAVTFSNHPLVCTVKT